MKVRINKASKPYYWYSDHIDKIFEIIGDNDVDYLTPDGKGIVKCDCTIVPELSNAEQVEIIRKVREIIKNETISGLCSAVHQATGFKYSLHEIPVLMKYKPSNTKGDYWFRAYDKEPRLAICDKALADLEGDDIKAFAEAHPEAVNKPLRELYPDKFEEEIRLDENYSHGDNLINGIYWKDIGNGALALWVNYDSISINPPLYYEPYLDGNELKLRKK